MKSSRQVSVAIAIIVFIVATLSTMMYVDRLRYLEYQDSQGKASRNLPRN